MCDCVVYVSVLCVCLCVFVCVVCVSVSKCLCVFVCVCVPIWCDPIHPLPPSTTIKGDYGLCNIVRHSLGILSGQRCFPGIEHSQQKYFTNLERP